MKFNGLKNKDASELLKTAELNKKTKMKSFMLQMARDAKKKKSSSKSQKNPHSNETTASFNRRNVNSFSFDVEFIFLF